MQLAGNGLGDHDVEVAARGGPEMLAIAVYDNLIDRFGSDTEAPIRVQVARRS